MPNLSAIAPGFERIVTIILLLVLGSLGCSKDQASQPEPQRQVWRLCRVCCLPPQDSRGGLSCS